MAEHQLAAADNGAVVRAQPGDVVIVTLDENPTTGYLWEIGGRAAGELVGEEADYVPAPGGAIGAGGQRQFAFRVPGPGRVAARLVLRRPWEPPECAIGEWHVVVDVVPPAQVARGNA